MVTLILCLIPAMLCGGLIGMKKTEASGRRVSNLHDGHSGCRTADKATGSAIFIKYLAETDCLIQRNHLSCQTIILSNKQKAAGSTDPAAFLYMRVI